MSDLKICAAPPPKMLPGVESTDLGDMLELRIYEIGWDRFRFRWDALVDGEHRVVAHDWWSPNYSDALPELEAMRDRARDAFLSTLKRRRTRR